MTPTISLPEAERLVTSPTTYADDDLHHRVLATFRAESPVHYVEVDGFNPFWLVTSHRDVVSVLTDSETFVSTPRSILQSAAADDFRRERNWPIRMLTQMSDPDHAVYRGLVLDWFRPKRINELGDSIRRYASDYIDRLESAGGECDFVEEVALHYPLHVILTMLGLPQSDFDWILRLTQELFGENDAEMRRGSTPEEQFELFEDFFRYFDEVTRDRRQNPTDDLASAIANARPYGELMPERELFSYYILIATAGHDTTSATLSGGLRALLDHPEQFDRLMSDPTLLPTAVEEMLRWVSPVRQFMRQATADARLGDTLIPEGDHLLVSFPSANRDEEAWEGASTFDIARKPNRHLAFGRGAHLCLGAQLARLEIRALFEEMLRRIHRFELAGPPVGIETLFVGGLRSLPIRYEMKSR